MWQLTKGMASLISDPDWHTHRREKGPTPSLSMILAVWGSVYCTGSLSLLVLHGALRRLEMGQMAACRLKELWELT